jgi:hypothetical protein
MIPRAERMDAVDRAGILFFRGLKSLQPARQLILRVRGISTTIQMTSHLAPIQG